MSTFIVSEVPPISSVRYNCMSLVLNHWYKKISSLVFCSSFHRAKDFTQEFVSFFLKTYHFPEENPSNPEHYFSPSFFLSLRTVDDGLVRYNAEGARIAF